MPNSKKKVIEKSHYFNENQDSALIEWIINLSKIGDSINEVKVEELVKDLYSIYVIKGIKCHHNYVAINSALQFVDRFGEDKWDSLINNINKIAQSYKEDMTSDDDISYEIIKLKNHIELERARFTQYKAIVSKIEETSQDLIKNSDDANSKYEKLKADFDNNKVQSVTILGIFASIVITFVGGFAFSTSVFNNMKDTPLFKLLALMSLTGLIFFDVVWIMINTIARLTLYRPEKEPGRFIGIVVNSILLVCFITFLSLSLAFEKHVVHEERNTTEKTITEASVSINLESQAKGYCKQTSELPEE